MRTKSWAILAVAALIAGCGGGDGIGTGVNANATFVAAVLAAAATSSDTTEAASIDGFAASGLDTEEPSPI